MPTVKFVNEKITVDVPEGSNLRKVAAENGVQLYSGIHKVLNCHGFGQCGSCSVILKGEGEENRPLNLLEKVSFGRILFEQEGQNVRLACQTKVTKDLEVRTHPGMNLHGERFFA